MTTTATLTAVPTVTRQTSQDDQSLALVDWLAPDAGSVRMPGCFESVPDTLDAVTAHEQECTDCMAAAR